MFQKNSEGMQSLVCKMKKVEANLHRISSMVRCFVESDILAHEVDDDDKKEEGDENMGSHEVKHEDGDEEAASTPPDFRLSSSISIFSIFTCAHKNFSIGSTLVRDFSMLVTALVLICQPKRCHLLYRQYPGSHHQHPIFTYQSQNKRLW